MITVYTKNIKAIQIDENLEIQRGGEGAIIKFNNNKVVKIYHKGINGITEEVFWYLKKLPSQIFVIPDELFYSADNKIVGFSMEYLSSEYLPISNLFNKNFCDKFNLTLDFKLKIARQLVEAIKIAHNENIVIGDFNQFNILFNLNGTLKCIDTDSYQVPNVAHSGRLLEEIRDYLYQGIVSIQSDYFALAVQVFYLFTFAHPYKGISATVKKMQDRMILKIPIFAADIIKPKVYTPIIWKNLQNLFERIFVFGERFLLNLNDNFQVQTVKKQIVNILNDANLFIKQFLNHTEIIDIEFISNKGYAETTENFILFSANEKGQLHDFCTLKKIDFEDIFLSENYFFAKKDKKLYKIDRNNTALEIVNFEFPEFEKSIQYGNTLLSIGSNQMYTIELSSLYNNNLKVKRTEIFSENIFSIPNFIQNTGGTYRLFYDTGSNLANVKMSIIPKKLMQSGKIGVVQYIENKQVINKYFLINGLQFELINHIELSDFVHFAFQKNNHLGFIYESADNEILIRRLPDFEIISTIKTELVSTHSKLYHTSSGIVCLSENNLFLLNKK